jgi:hypothetical protein
MDNFNSKKLEDIKNSEIMQILKAMRKFPEQAKVFLPYSYFRFIFTRRNWSRKCFK